MASLTVSYGLISPQSPDKKNSHILPVTRILHPKLTDDYYLTTARDGSVVLHPYENGNCKDSNPIRFQIHSDWVNDIIEINQHSYITTSHDFSIVHISLHRTDNNNSWSCKIKIIGNHNDYIKCISFIPKHDLFVTGGLDSFIKIWKISYDTNNNFIEPHFELYHSFFNEVGSIYNLATLRTNSNEFDLIAGDCNGDLLFYSCCNKKEIKRIIGAHETNIKVVRLIDNETKLLSTCSNGVIHIWDISDINNLQRIKSWKWNCSIWCIDGNSLDNLLLGDSLGNINKFNFTNLDKIQVELLYNSKEYFSKNKTLIVDDTENSKDKTKHLGILDLKLLDNQNIYFSYCSDSNLNHLNLETNTLYIDSGGFALTRSSLLTNRRHVITENTQGKIQRWDIVTCELINTFPTSEGSFDQIVVKYTSKEILSHWCTVSVKVGMLFVKMGPRFSSTEIYGSALSNYDIMNNVEVNSDNRYNIGKIVVNSLLNEFMEYECKKDEIFRKGLGNKKKDHNNNNNSYTNTTGSRASISNSSSTTPKTKDKFKKISAFTKLGSSISIGASSKPETPYVSAPTTPIDKEKHIPDEISNAYYSNWKPNNVPRTAPASIPFEKQASQGDILNPIPKISSGRASSSGSLLSRKFKSLRLSKNDSSLDGSKISHSDDDERFVDQMNLSIDTEIPEEPKLWNKGYNSSDKAAVSPFNTVKTSDGGDSVYLKTSDNDKPDSRTQSTLTLNHNQNSPEVKTEQKQFMVDLISEFHNSYLEQYSGNLTSLKLLTRRIPDSLIKRDSTSPIVRIKLATLVVVHAWKQDISGGSVLSSNIIPPTSKRRELSNLHSLESSQSSLPSDTSDPLLTYEDSQTNILNENTHNYGNDNEKSKNHSDEGENESNLSSSKIELYEHLENDLPYWFAKKLCKDVRLVDEQQPKLNFILQPWLSEEQAFLAEKEPVEVVKPEQRHHKFKFGESNGTGATDLPKISDLNTRLIAPGMIKVKKIKLYVIDRFETKTAEMKAKIDPSDWLEILCKGQVLDNDMTLSTVRTLYWKSQGEIVLNYRRKIAPHSVTA